MTGVNYIVNSNTIVFDSENMVGQVNPKDITLYKGITFEKIVIGYQMKSLGTILRDIARNFKAPGTLELNLFHAIKQADGSIFIVGDLNKSEREVRIIFSNWTGQGVNVILSTSNLALREFKL